jgi:hypothetical protein
LRLDKRVSSRIKSKVSLVHELFVKWRIHCSVVAGRARRPCFLTFEKLGQNKLFLVNHHIDVHTLALNSSTKVS